MPPPPPHRHFQIHLSTAIVLMFVAGGLIWANVREKPSVIVENEMPSSPLRKKRKYTYISYFNCRGWPCCVTSNNPLVKLWQPDTEVKINYLNAGLDVATAALLLFLVWFILESLIRRRAAQKES
ncbi:MAG: hypothetical protein WCT04_25900 [Planctomycetota bacterium]